MTTTANILMESNTYTDSNHHWTEGWPGHTCHCKVSPKPLTKVSSFTVCTEQNYKRVIVVIFALPSRWRASCCCDKFHQTDLVSPVSSKGDKPTAKDSKASPPHTYAPNPAVKVVVSLMVTLPVLSMLKELVLSTGTLTQTCNGLTQRGSL